MNLITKLIRQYILTKNMPLRSLSPVFILKYILAITLLVHIQTCQSISFDLKPNAKRCLKEEMRKNQLAVGEYTVSSGSHGSFIKFQITDSKQHSALIRDNIDGKGKFAVTSDEDDIFDFCFTYTTQPHMAEQAQPREISLDVRLGVEAKEYDDPSNDKLKKIENELNKLSELSESIIEDFAHLKQREKEMRDTNESTSNKVYYQTVVSVIILLALTTWQVLHLRKFFKQRRLID